MPQTNFPVSPTTRWRRVDNHNDYKQDGMKRKTGNDRDHSPPYFIYAGSSIRLDTFTASDGDSNSPSQLKMVKSYRKS